MYNAVLAQILEFDEQDLSAHRDGQLSERQRLFLQSRLLNVPPAISPVIVVALSIGFMGIALALIWIIGSIREPFAILGIVITAGIALPFALWLMKSLDQGQSLGNEIDLKPGNPAVIEGKMTAYVGWWIPRAIYDKPCYIQLDRQAFRIRGGQLRLLRPYLKQHHNHRYRAYYFNQTLFSVDV
ncbi:MAG TPA: hypothetical protein VHL11_04360, partial [Phototrophicaceae bacterium]|nr:hypothetical protein [Phototrophicaceae bacterium]